MTLKNTHSNYGLIARFFHWAIAFIILGFICVGFYMTSLAYSPEKIQLYGTHKSFGLLVLWLAGLRLIWRQFSKPPTQDLGHKLWEKILARAAHFLLYVAMIGMPLTGWLMSSAGEYPVPFFGLDMPDLVGKNPSLAMIMKEAHEVIAFILIGVIALHAMGALKHHFMDKDDTFKRMAGAATSIKATIVIIILVIFFAVVGYLFVTSPKEYKQKITSDTIASEIAVTQVTDIASTVQRWVISPKDTALTFQASVIGKEFTGRFNDIDGDIYFDPNNLESSKIKIIIQTGSLDSDDKERDEQMKSAEWFYISSYPEAVFESIAFEPALEGQFIAVGNLTIRDVTMPVMLPFTLELKENGTQAHVKGMAALNRLDFGLGQGQWSETDTVGAGVRVKINLKAEAQN